MAGPSVVVHFALPVTRRRALESALLQVLGGRPWHLVVRPVLLYVSPRVGTWWAEIALRGSKGTFHTFMLPPGQHGPEVVASVVARALRGGLVVACAGCGRIRDADTWTNGSSKPHAFGVCPACAMRLQPQAGRRRRGRP